MTQQHASPNIFIIVKQAPNFYFAFKQICSWQKLIAATNESDATTFVVPDGFETTIDKHRLFHLKEVK